MAVSLITPEKATAVLVYGRPFLVFGGMLCAVAVMWSPSPTLYTLGVVLLLVSMSFDLVDGWFAARFRPHSALAHLADRLMDKIVFSIIFPLVSVGEMWRLHAISSDPGRTELLHAIFVLFLCIAVLLRDNFANFMRGFAVRKGQEPEAKEFTRLRTVVAAPVSALLYAHAFFVPQDSSSALYAIVSFLGNFPLQGMFFIEILFLIITFGSIAGYCRKYGSHCLDELSLGDDLLRRRILAFFPNALTVMNAIMGLLAVFFAYQARIQEAYLMLIGAALFDKVDGALARRLGLSEGAPGDSEGRSITFGGILDDVADAMSFCIAPAWIFYILFSDPGSGSFLRHLPAGFFALAYAVLGIFRLIYFTLDRTPIPGFFKGFPSPAAALLVVAPMIMYARAVDAGTDWADVWGTLTFVLILVSAFLMNFYPLRYLHLGRFMSGHPWFGRLTGLLAAVFVFTPYFGLAALIYMLLYVISPLVTRDVSPEEAAKESQSGSPAPDSNL